MKSSPDTLLQSREVFHLEFLRWFATRMEPERYALKGGINLRFFYKSCRYSEDMDIDLKGTNIETIKKNVIGILSAKGFQQSLKSFGITRLTIPDLARAKQTKTTQRFKVHLFTAQGEELFTKIEFSRRKSLGTVMVESLPREFLQSYKLTPFWIPHYDVYSAVWQKIRALALRNVLQARDIFDLFILSAQYPIDERRELPGKADKPLLQTAYRNIFLVNFHHFRDTVVTYLAQTEQKIYASPAVWDDIQLKTARFLEGFSHDSL